MFYANDKNGVRVFADDAIKSEEYFCPECNGELIVRTGELNCAHFAHKSGECSDSWSYDMSAWHRMMQDLFPKENQEVVVTYGGKTHRADVLIDKTVIEFQYSPISVDEFCDRNEFFMDQGYRIAWVFYVGDQVQSEQIEYLDDSNEMMKWRNPFRLFAYAPTISDSNTNFSLYLAGLSEDEGYDDCVKVTWCRSDDDGYQSMSRFAIDNRSWMGYDDHHEPFNIDIDAMFESRVIRFKKYISERIMELGFGYSMKYKGERGHSRNDYMCPLKYGEFGIELYGERGCLYCPYCLAVGDMERGRKTFSKVVCTYPNECRPLDPLAHPGYPCHSVERYDI